MIPIHHPGYGAPYDAFEYPFPVTEEQFRDEHTESLSQWSRRFVGMDAAEVKALLQTDWASMRQGAAVKFRDYLLDEFEPRSMVVVVGTGIGNTDYLALSSKRDGCTVMQSQPVSGKRRYDAPANDAD